MPDPLVGMRLLEDLRHHVRTLHEREADELRIVDGREDVVDLHVDELLDTLLAQAVELAALDERREDAAVPVGVLEQDARLGERARAAWSRLGTVPCAKNESWPAASPKSSCARKNARVSSSVIGLVSTSSGTS